MNGPQKQYRERDIEGIRRDYGATVANVVLRMWAKDDSRQAATVARATRRWWQRALGVVLLSLFLPATWALICGTIAVTMAATWSFFLHLMS